MASDMELVAGLVQSNPEAAERLARLSVLHERASTSVKALDFELNFMLDLMREMPVAIERDDEGAFVAARWTAVVPPDGFVVKDCPRLRSLLRGEIPALNVRAMG